MGAVVPIEQLLYGIKAVETGGERNPYQTVNSIGAHGAYQVMRQYIAGWTKEALGRTLTPAQFLASPADQDAVARFRLARDMKKYNSWQSAASIWFSGQPDPDSLASDGGNTVRQYVEKVQKAMESAGGQGAAKDSGAAPTNPSGGGLTGLVPDSITDALGSVAGAVTDIAKGLGSVGTVATFLMGLALPSTWVRIVSGLLGSVLLLLGLLVLGREAKGTA